MTITRNLLEALADWEDVTAPRQVIAGMCAVITRRTTQRSYLLRPDPVVEEIYLYCLAEAAQRFRVTLFGWLAMSNHQHVSVRDNLGNLPEFMAHLNKMTAKALNAYWGRAENLWSSEQPSVVRLIETQDCFDKLVYILANPVAAHLVDRVSDWPGASSFSQNLSGRARVVKRPHGFFRKKGPMPDKVVLRAERLPGFEHLSQAEWSAKIAAAVAAAEHKARRERAISKRGVLGRKAVLATKHTDSPSTVAPRGRLRPHLACRNPERRAQELAKVRAFRVAHRDSLLHWIAGQRDVRFPLGTYQMHALFGVRRTRSPAIGSKRVQAATVPIAAALRRCGTRDGPERPPSASHGQPS